MRSVFQAQPEVGHVYLGSKRHVLERIFNDRNEPFWRSAKRLEIGTIRPAKFAAFIASRFLDTERTIGAVALDRLLAATGGHPYGTQELAYFVWELVPPGGEAGLDEVGAALGRVLRSEHNHFADVWNNAPHQQRLLMLAIADEPTATIYARDYHSRHQLPANPSLQTALAALVKKEIAGRSESGEYSIIEPFLADWLRREQRDYGLAGQLRSGSAAPVVQRERGR
jgi:hypothetical protein